MNQILISPTAINFLPALAWHVLVLGYLLRQRAKSKPTWLFTGWMVGLTLVIAASFLPRLIYAPLGGYIYWIGGILSAWLALTFELQLAYHFSGTPWPREARAALLISITLLLGLALEMAAEVILIPHQVAYSFPQFLYGIYRLDNQDIFVSAAVFNIMHPIGHVWAVIVLLRKIFYLTVPQPRQPWPRRLWEGLWRPRSKVARSVRTLTLLVVITPLLAGADILETHYLLPSGSFALVYMLCVFTIVLVYVENAPEPSPFVARVIGVSLATVLLTIGLVAPWLLALGRETYVQTHRAELAHLQTLLETNAPDWVVRVPADVAYIAARPAAGGVFSTEYRMLFSRDPALTADLLTRHDAEMKTGLALGWLSARMNMVDQNPWLDPRQFLTQNAASYEQLQLPEGVLSYRQLGRAWQIHVIRYNFAGRRGERLYEAGYNYPAYRQELHQQALPLLFLILGATGLSLLIFPYVFRGSLVQPLANLLAGVRRIDAGDLDVNVPLHMADEIGRVTDAFNRMARSLQAAIAEQQRAEAEVQALNLNLEQQIADRMRELSILYEVSAIAGHSQSLERLLDDLLRRIITAAEVEAGVVYLIEAGNPAAAGDLPAGLKLVVSQGFTPQTCPTVGDWPDGGAVLIEVLGRGEPLLIAEAAADTRLPAVIQHSNLATLLLIPLQANYRPLGLLGLGRCPGLAFSLEEIALLASVADQVALSIDSARLRHQSTLLQERQRLSRELHDAVLQSLYGLAMLADVGAAQPEHDTVSTFARIRDIARQAIQEMRLFIYQLQPIELEQGLVAALHHRLAAVEGRVGLGAHLLVEDNVPPSLPIPVRHALYQVAQEALNNILRHAHATNVTIHLDYQDDQYILEIRDDGCGFDPQAPGAGGMGLDNMRQRMAEIGGRLDITSAPGQGTNIRAGVRLTPPS